MTDFPQVQRSEATALASIYGVIVVFGSLSNGIIIATYVKWRHTMLKEPRDILIFSLAVGDFIMCSTVCPFGFASAVSLKWTAGESGCIWYGFTSTWVGLSGMLQLAVISMERYLTLLNRNSVLRTWVKCFTLFAWTFSFISSCFPLFGWSKYTFEGFGFHCSIHWSNENMNYGSYSLYLLVLFFVFPLFFICFAYTKVFFIVKHMSQNAAEMWGRNSEQTRETYLVEVKVAKQLFIVTGGFLFAWTPYAIGSIIVVFTNYKLSSRVQTLPAIFAKTSNIYNPIIYFFTYKRLLNRARYLFYDIGSSLHSRESRGLHN